MSWTGAVGAKSQSLGAVIAASTRFSPSRAGRDRCTLYHLGSSALNPEFLEGDDESGSPAVLEACVGTAVSLQQRAIKMAQLQIDSRPQMPLFELRDTGYLFYFLNWIYSLAH